MKKKRQKEDKIKTSKTGQKVRFELTYPHAKEVFLAGTFNNWQPSHSLKSVGGGKWEAELTLTPGRYEYRFVVNGEWISDPNAKDFVPNPFGGVNSALEVQ